MLIFNLSFNFVCQFNLNIFENDKNSSSLNNFNLIVNYMQHSDEVGLTLATKGEMICKSNIQQQTAGHDTLGLIVLDTYGNIGAGSNYI